MKNVRSTAAPAVAAPAGAAPKASAGAPAKAPNGAPAKAPRRGPAKAPTDAPVSPRPVTPRASARSMYLLHHLLEPNAGYRRLSGWLEAMPRLRRLFTAAEKGVKKEIFGCHMCGQCALPSTGYACPMTCPKQLRNGPCGGVGSDGSCEVYPQMQCVWVTAFQRAKSQGRASDLERLQLPIDHRVWGQSSWVRYWQGRDEDLWIETKA